uniref:HTH CENPB-type domain-containing protein n=1 Tax=Timema tahoe TaxID=61484 RepID=A0A7R9IQM0_9NEOP|nr:unnamed protein product [Timema tahoe]
MSSKRKSDARNTGLSKRSRKAITLEVKHKMLNLHDSGMKVSKLAAAFGMSHSSVSGILKEREKYLEQVNSAVPMQSTVVRRREGLIPEVEKILIAWVNQQTQTVHRPPDQAEISAKALSVFEAIKEWRGDAAKDETFNASKGWYSRFKKRAGWQNVASQEDEAQRSGSPSRKATNLRTTMQKRSPCLAPSTEDQTLLDFGSALQNRISVRARALRRALCRIPSLLTMSMLKNMISRIV